MTKSHGLEPQIERSFNKHAYEKKRPARKGAES